MDGKGAEMSKIILTDEMIKKWLEEIPNMRNVTDNYPPLAALSMSVVFEILELSLKELASFRTRIAELEALTTWQPIETAPEGQSILLGWFVADFWRIEQSSRYNSTWRALQRATHWMPLPKPPEEQK
jgi:hypothetical protein